MWSKIPVFSSSCTPRDGKGISLPSFCCARGRSGSLASQPGSTAPGASGCGVGLQVLVPPLRMGGSDLGKQQKSCLCEHLPCYLGFFMQHQWFTEFGSKCYKVQAPVHAMEGFVCAQCRELS